MKRIIQQVRSAFSRDVSIMDSSMDQDAQVIKLTPAQTVPIEPRVSPLVRILDTLFVCLYLCVVECN